MMLYIREMLSFNWTRNLFLGAGFASVKKLYTRQAHLVHSYIKLSFRSLVLQPSSLPQLSPLRWASACRHFALFWSRVRHVFYVLARFYQPLRKDGTAFSSVCLWLCLSVCLSFCQDDNSWTVRAIITKSSGPQGIIQWFKWRTSLKMAI